MQTYKFIVQFIQKNPRSTYYLNEAHALGFHALQRIILQDLYFIEGQLSQDDCKQLALKLLIDPVTQSASWTELPSHPSVPGPDTVILEVALRPGVTDPVAEQIVRAAHELGFDGIQRAATGQRFLLTFNEAINESTFTNKLARQLLANPVIHHWTLGPITPSFPQETESSGAVEIIPVRNLTNTELLTISKVRRAALDLIEMKAIQEYYLKEKRDPTDVEFETIAQTWSEHCGHKTFKAKVDVESSKGNYQIDSIIKTYLKSATNEINAPWVISAFVDNAGIIDFDDEYEISFKELRKLILKKKVEFKLPNGEIAIIQESWLIKYGDLFAMSETHGDHENPAGIG